MHPEAAQTLLLLLSATIITLAAPQKPSTNLWLPVAVTSQELLGLHAEDRENEDVIRTRMSVYAEDKFRQGYHLWPNGTIGLIVNHNLGHLVAEKQQTGRKKKKDKNAHNDHKVHDDFRARRRRRDFGVVSGPVTTAVVSGVIGMSGAMLRDVMNYQQTVTQGGCEWFGTAPLCNYHCPSDYDYIRQSNGRCSSWWFSDVCVPDDSFGKPCSTLFGTYFKKRFCCKSDPQNCEWSGKWMSASTAHNFYCRYDVNPGRCGLLDCAVNHQTFKAQNESDISGDRCDRLNMFGLRGKATCGYIAWFDDKDNVVDSWYKTK